MGEGTLEHAIALGLVVWGAKCRGSGGSGSWGVWCFTGSDSWGPPHQRLCSPLQELLGSAVVARAVGVLTVPPGQDR